MNDIVIKVDGVSKQYRLGQIGRKSLSNDFNRWWHTIRGKEDPYLKVGQENDRSKKGTSEYVWSLRDINFCVKKGEVLGIIGSNGAGKSTLLKLLSKITTPTTGSIKLKGRVASLLEVGTGFNPELSGRDNIYLNGAILGMTKKEISSKFDEIVDFAGVEKYIDTPVKRYSSGMYVRLAFAVAAHLEPEILIVDEVLAVGDVEFQKKCLGKMKDVSEKDGRTILFVSHNMDAVSRLCTKGIYLKNGKVEQIDKIDNVISTYLQGENAIVSYARFEEGNQPGNNIVKLLSAEIINHEYENAINFKLDNKIGVRFDFAVLQETDDLVGSINIFDNKEFHIFTSHDIENIGKRYRPGKYSLTVWIPSNLLNDGIFYCGVALVSYKPWTIHFHKMCLCFNLLDVSLNTNIRNYFTGNIPGVVRPSLSWEDVVQL